MLETDICENYTYEILKLFFKFYLYFQTYSN